MKQILPAIRPESLNTPPPLPTVLPRASIEPVRKWNLYFPYENEFPPFTMLKFHTSVPSRVQHCSLMQQTRFPRMHGIPGPSGLLTCHFHRIFPSASSFVAAGLIDVLDVSVFVPFHSPNDRPAHGQNLQHLLLLPVFLCGVESLEPSRLTTTRAARYVKIRQISRGYATVRGEATLLPAKTEEPSDPIDTAFK